MRLSSLHLAFVIVFSLTLSGCPYRPVVEVPPPPIDAKLTVARIAFTQGDWDRLRSLISQLPGEGEFLIEAMFYQALTIGLGQSVQGEKRLKTLESKARGSLREKIKLYRWIFKAKSGGCLLAEGPLRRVYQPQIDRFGRGSRSQLEDALKSCEEMEQKRSEQMVKLQASTHKAPSDKISEAPPEKNPIEPSPPSLDQLTIAERQSVEPYIQMWLPINKRARPTLLNTLLRESTPLLTDDRERRGEPLKIEGIDVGLSGEQMLAKHLAEMRSEVDVILAAPTHPKLHQEILSASQDVKRPMFLLSPFKVDDQSESSAKDQTEDLAPIWRVYVASQLIARSLTDIAVRGRSQGIGLFYPATSKGERLRDLMKTELKAQGLELTHHQPISTSTQWVAIAQEVRSWPVDTLIFAQLGSTNVGTLASHLGAQGVWSAPPESFMKSHALSASSLKDDLYRRFLLWPSAYQPSTLQKAGRYLNGARTVTPVVVESEAFQKLNARFQRELGREAKPLEAIVMDLMMSIDEAVRLGESRQLSFTEAIRTQSFKTRFVLPFDFSKTNLINHLFELEIRAQRFIEVESDTPSKSKQDIKTQVKESPKESPKGSPKESPKESLKDRSQQTDPEIRLKD